MAKNTKPHPFCSPSVEVAEDMAMVTFPPLSRWKTGGPIGAEGAEGMTNAEPTSVQHRTQDKPSTEPKTSPNPHPFGELLNKKLPHPRQVKPSFDSQGGKKNGKGTKGQRAWPRIPTLLSFVPHPLK